MFPYVVIQHIGVVDVVSTVRTVSDFCQFIFIGHLQSVLPQCFKRVDAPKTWYATRGPLLIIPKGVAILVNETVKEIYEGKCLLSPAFALCPVSFCWMSSNVFRNISMKDLPLHHLLFHVSSTQ